MTTKLICKIVCAWMAATLVIAVDPCAGQGRTDPEIAVKLGGAARRTDAVLPDTLRDSQTNVKLPSCNGLTALMSAATSEEIPVAGLILDEEINIEGTSAGARKNLVCEASEVNSTTGKPLVDNHAACYAHNDGFTPLTRAIWSGDPTSDTVEFLLKHGANPNARDRYGVTPLARAICGPNPSSDVVKLLLKYGANPNATDEYGSTPLMRAASKGHAEIVRILIEKGANENPKDNNGRTPLLWAVWKNHPSVVLLLLNHGADVSARDVNGWTPLRRAESVSQDEIVEVLKAHGARK